MLLKYLFLALFILLSLTSAGSSVVGKFEKIVEILELDTNVKLPITIYVPKNIEIPVGLVIVSPGSDGEGSTYLEAELKKNKFEPDHQGGLVNLLINSGYALVFASQRGRLDVTNCISGAGFEERLKSYATNCSVKAIRKDVDLYTITSDIGKIYSHLEKHKLFRNVPLISLGYSEASYHISKLINEKKIQPMGIVFIGGLYKKSLAETAKSQLRRDFYFQKIEDTFRLTGKEKISFADVVEYGKLNFVLGHPNRPPWGLGITMGDIFITKAEAESRKVAFNKQYQQFIEFFEGKNLPTFTVAWVHEHQLLEYFTSAYVSQSYRANINNIELLKSYNGKVNFIFGDADSLVDIPNTADCALSAFKCSIEIVNGVGHGLEDESGYPTAESLRVILKAINSVAVKK
jgi:hypothetical protein